MKWRIDSAWIPILVILGTFTYLIYLSMSHKDVPTRIPLPSPTPSVSVTPSAR